MYNKLFALILVIILFPIILIIGVAIVIEDGFPIFFIQKRIFYICIIQNIYKCGYYE